MLFCFLMGLNSEFSEQELSNALRRAMLKLSTNSMLFGGVYLFPGQHRHFRGKQKLEQGRNPAVAARKQGRST